MANNRLYFYNPENNTVCFIAKAFGDGWYIPEHLDVKAAMMAFFEGGPDGFRADCDFKASLGHGPTELRLITDDDIPENVTYISAVGPPPAE